MFKSLIGLNEEAKKYIAVYKKKFAEAQARQLQIENYLNQEYQRRNRERNDGSVNRHERESSGGSKLRQSICRDMTPNKMGKQLMLQTNVSLTSSDSNITNMKSSGINRNIKTPQTQA